MIKEMLEKGNFGFMIRGMSQKPIKNSFEILKIANMKLLRINDIVQLIIHVSYLMADVVL